MNQTQSGLRQRICLIGETNVGKSSLMNALTQENVSLVSDIAGTTTDTVIKPFELLGLGAVTFCDTAGFGDTTPLGQIRLQRTLENIRTADLILIVRANSEITPLDEMILNHVQEVKTPYLIVYNKSDLYTPPLNSLAVNTLTGEGVNNLKEKIKNTLLSNDNNELLKGLIKSKERILLIAPIDDSAPKGRLILPQVQVLRECLDKHILTTVIQPEELETALAFQTYDLIITDSRVLKEVAPYISDKSKLTTFSILFARAKGDFDILTEGLKTLDKLTDGDGILIAEACSHTTAQDDIARMMIPKLLKKYTQKELQIEFAKGKDFPSDLNRYKLIIQCGGCMLTRQEMQQRIQMAKNQQIAITNYGLLIYKIILNQSENTTR